MGSWRVASKLAVVLVGLLFAWLASGCRTAPPVQGSAGGGADTSYPQEQAATQVKYAPEASATVPVVTPNTAPQTATVTPPGNAQRPDDPAPPDILTAQRPTSQPGFSFCSPLEAHSLEELPEIISDPYHPPPMGKDDRHQGVDFSYYRRDGRESILGEGVQAILAGKVAVSLDNKFPYGNMILIETGRAGLPDDLSERLGIRAGESLYVLYAHMQEPPEFHVGELVTACRRLGTVGKSGNAGVPHLHIEMRIGPVGKTFTSMLYYDTRATPEEMENYELWRLSGVFRHFNPMDLLQFLHKN